MYKKTYMFIDIRPGYFKKNYFCSNRLSSSFLYMQKKTTTNRIRKDQGISKSKLSLPELK